MSDVFFSSILIENKKMNKNDNSNIFTNGGRTLQSNNGIDFKNDTVLNTAQNEVDDAKGVENAKDLNKSFAQMNLAHINRDYELNLSQYEGTLTLEKIAKNATENLATAQASALQELSESNQSVAKLTADQAAAALKVSTLKSEHTLLGQEKAKKVGIYNTNINELYGQISASTTTKNRLSTNLSSKRSALSGLESKLSSTPKKTTTTTTIKDADGKESTITTEIDNSATINELNRDIEEKKKEIKNIEDQITELSTGISRKKSNLALQQSAREATIAAYDAALAEKAAQIAVATAEYNDVTDKLAQEIYRQTGLTLQAANLSEMMAESQLFERSVGQILSTILEKLTKSEEKQNEAEGVVNEKDEEYKEAENTSKVKENKLATTEEEEKQKYGKKDDEQNMFLA